MKDKIICLEDDLGIAIQRVESEWRFPFLNSAMVKEYIDDQEFVWDCRTERDAAGRQFLER
jgi:hypothetical protein